MQLRPPTTQASTFNTQTSMETFSTPSRSGSVELLLVSPLIANASRRSSRTRRVTPEWEASSPKTVAVISPSRVTPFQSQLRRPAEFNPLRWPAVAREARIGMCTLTFDRSIAYVLDLDARQLLLPNPLAAPPTHIGKLAPSSMETVVLTTSIAGPIQPGSVNDDPFRSAPQRQWSQLLQKARQVTVPFDLRHDASALSDPHNRDMLMQIFPNTHGFGSDGSFLYIYVSEMPPKPWPKTIAGLPLYLAPRPGPDHCPMPVSWSVHRRNGTIADRINGRDMKPWAPLFQAVRDHFLALKISITQVIYWGNYLDIVLEDRDVDTSKLPWKAAQILCKYLYADQMGTPRLPQARRLTDPTPGNPDQSQYTSLQPGMRISSGHIASRPGMFQATTSGVLVKDLNRNEFMTVASHGFLGECGTNVHHPLPTDGRKIGELIYEVTHTDIAMVKLEPHEKFVNVTFESDYITQPIQLKQLAQADKLRKGDAVVLDSPDTGCIDGIFQAPAYQRVPTDDPTESKQHWVLTTWYYMGQDSGLNLQAGMCGSAIWTEEGDVVGFFRYAPAQVNGNGGAMQDWCAATAADELINRGFTLVDTSGLEL